MSEAQAIEPRPGVTVVTGENFDEYVNEKLGVTAAPAEPEESAAEVETPEAKAAAELAEIEAKQAEEAKVEPKEGDIDGSKVYFKGKWTSKHDFEYRLHLRTKEEKAAVEEKLAKAADETKAERTAREAAEKRAAELQAKYEPPKSDEIGPKPKTTDYSDIDKYSADLEEWAVNKSRIEAKQEAQKQSEAREAEIRAKSWKSNVEAVAKELPDYNEVINNATEVTLSDQARDAILESDAGPKILYHLAKNPEVAAELGKMSVAKMLREIGKLEATLGGPAKPATKSAPASSVAEISRAPAPIEPLNGGGAAVIRLTGSDEVPANLSYEAWKKLRIAGKIK